MIREIGSEFHRMPPEKGPGLPLPRAGSLVFSGRTALAAVLSRLPKARTALLPSYCCESMIVPFRDAGIRVRFYDVNWQDGMRVDLKGTADVLLWCNYFGYRMDMPAFDGPVIEDITHSLLSLRPCHGGSDYLVASLRKWEPLLCGGYCSVQTEGEEPPEAFLALKAAAMDLKAAYLLDGDEGKKPAFLEMFAQSNRFLGERCSGLAMDHWSREYLAHVDAAAQRRIRRQNARVLYEGLGGRVPFLFPEADMDCPLFVPILLDHRDRVRQRLIESRIYCPVHWPRPEGCASDIYDRELSLICDQRYGVDDMERIVSVLSQAI